MHKYKKSLIRDYNRRQFFNKKAQYLNIIKLLTINNILDLKKRNYINYLNNSYNSKTKIRNHCLITGRSRGLIRNYKCSRIMFKQLTAMAYLPGVKLSSW